jgi:hypothetical protein
MAAAIMQPAWHGQGRPIPSRYALVKFCGGDFWIRLQPFTPLVEDSVILSGYTYHLTGSSARALEKTASFVRKKNCNRRITM